MNRQKEASPFHKHKHSQNIISGLLKNKQTTKKIVGNERVKGIEHQRVLIWSKHTSYNSDFTNLLLGKGHGPKHTLDVWKSLKEIRILKNSLQSAHLTQSNLWVH